MDLKTEWKKLAAIVAIFAACFFLPLGWARFEGAIYESLHLARQYARRHVLLSLVPAFFIAGGVAAFISGRAVMKYLGPKANKLPAYGVASVSGSILAVCSCTVLPMFAGIYRMGAGIGPATTFLYSGPAVNVLAIVLTAAVLGPALGVARAVGAVVFSIVIGLAMHLIFRKEDRARAPAAPVTPQQAPTRPLWKNAVFFATMVGILVGPNWARSGDVRAVFLCCPDGLAEYEIRGRLISQDAAGATLIDSAGIERQIPAEQLREITPVSAGASGGAASAARWLVVGLLLIALSAMTAGWFNRSERREWVRRTWGLAKQILPLLFIGVLLAGFLLGSPGREGVVPSSWIESAVGGNSVRANFFASLAGAPMYFATLTEVPIVQGLIGAGMGKGPALALLLAGPALSLPNMLVIRSVLGTKRTLVYVVLVVMTASASGTIFGMIAPG